MKNKIIILVVRRHAGEVDWILPLLYKFKLKKYKIITIFSESYSYESLKNNIEIYNIWKNISFNHYVINSYNSLFWKILQKITTRLFFKHKKLYKWIEKKIFVEIFDIDRFQKKLNFNIQNVKAIFAPNIHFSKLPIFFKKYNPNLSIIRFPESAMISSTNKQNPKIKYNSLFRDVVGDLFLFSSKSDKEFFLGNDNKKKVYYCGYLRHQKWWTKKFISKKNRNKNFKVLIAVRNPQKNYLNKSNFVEMINSLMIILSKIKNVKIIFKIHPQDKSIKILNNILLKYNRNIWMYKKNHMMKLSSESNMCITIITSACLDALAVGIPTLEYYKIKSELKKSSNLTNCVHMAYSSKTKKWHTIFNIKKLVNTVDSFEELENNINLIYKKNYQKINNFNQKNFKKLIGSNINLSQKVLNHIENNFF